MDAAEQLFRGVCLTSKQRVDCIITSRPLLLLIVKVT